MKQIVRWLHSRSQRRVLILGYHRVADESSDPFDLTVTPAALDAQLAYLARRTRPVSLRQAVSELVEGTPHPRSVVVTFDDGYHDTLATALPLLERHRMPATVFVTTGNPGEPFWWEVLARSVSTATRLPDPVSIELNGRTMTLSTRDPVAFLQRLAAALQGLDSDSRTATLGALIQRWKPARVESAARALREDEIERLGSHPLIEIGGHSVTHSALAGLSLAQQRSEIGENRRTLERVLGAAVTSFSYPHGSYAADTQEILRAEGYQAACSSVPDAATARSDVLALPRLWVDGRRSRRFERSLERWL